jgi:UDP-N-acetylmuramate dehydrogenase
MPEIIENAPLKQFNSFGIEANAKYLCLYHKPEDLKYFIEKGPLNRDEQMIILGGGSNTLFTGDFNGVVIHPVNNFIEKIDENNDFCFVKAGAGTNWDELVAWAVDRGLGGIENLSNIPGNVGAAPVQNIGAYGVEVKDTVHEVHLVSFENGSLKTISNEECKFGYRTSAFKNKLKNRYLVDSVTFRLTKKPVYVTHYGNILHELALKGETSLKNIREVIINIRKNKLPDPNEIGNAGSFFKNPVIDQFTTNNLLKIYPDMVIYPIDDLMVKLGAGWMIENCGLKGYKNSKGNAGVHNKQALVLVNYGNAKGSDILEVAHHIQKKVFEKFDVYLEPEVLVV